MKKTIYEFAGRIILDNQPSPLQDALNLLQEEGFCTATDFPEFTHGQKLSDANGDECHFIAPSKDGRQAVVQFANGTLALEHWGDLAAAESGS